MPTIPIIDVRDEKSINWDSLQAKCCNQTRELVFESWASYTSHCTFSCLYNSDSEHGNLVHMRNWDKFHSWLYTQSPMVEYKWGLPSIRASIGTSTQLNILITSHFGFQAESSTEWFWLMDIRYCINLQYTKLQKSMNISIGFCYKH